MNYLTRLSLASLFVFGAACGDDDEVLPDASQTADAATADAPPIPDGAPPDANPQLARGQYLVHHVAACIDCHTPRNQDGSLDTSKLLAGSATFADLDPADDQVGLVPTPNLTPHATGLGDWTAAEIKTAFLDGIDKDSNPLFPIMPYYVFHNMTADDADAIVAYLQSLDPIDNTIPDRQPLGFPFNSAAQPVPVGVIPDTTLADTDPNYASAQQGRYLAGMIGICLECHTERVQAAVPLDTTKMFGGGEGFTGFPSPPFPEVIYSANVTPHATGIQGWTAEQVKIALKEGLDDDGDGICPPMPAGPMQAFGGLTDEDALAIGHYITTIPPIDNTVPNDCTPPAP